MKKLLGIVVLVFGLVFSVNAQAKSLIADLKKIKSEESIAYYMENEIDLAAYQAEAIKFCQTKGKGKAALGERSLFEHSTTIHTPTYSRFLRVFETKFVKKIYAKNRIILFYCIDNINEINHKIVWSDNSYIKYENQTQQVAKKENIINLIFCENKRKELFIKNQKFWVRCPPSYPKRITYKKFKNLKPNYNLCLLKNSMKIQSQPGPCNLLDAGRGKTLKYDYDKDNFYYLDESIKTQITKKEPKKKEKKVVKKKKKEKKKVVKLKSKKKKNRSKKVQKDEAKRILEKKLTKAKAKKDNKLKAEKEKKIEEAKKAETLYVMNKQQVQLDKLKSLIFKKKDKIVMEDVVKLGSYQPIKEIPEGMVKKLGKACKVLYCQSKKAGQYVYKVFVKSSKMGQQRNPGNMIYGMAMYEILYLQKLRKAERSIKRYIKKGGPKGYKPAEWIFKSADEGQIRSVVKMNKGRKKMRAALGMDINLPIETVLKRYWLLGDFLNDGKIKVKRAKIDRDVKKRKALLEEYRAALNKLKKKIEENENL